MAAESNSLVMSQSSSVRVAEMLIELARNHPVLCDKRHPKHKDSLLKDDLWGKIGSELGMTGMQAHAKFKNLKDTFTKHKNKIKGSMNSGAGAADVPTVKWVHFKAMMSLMGPILKEPIISTNVGFINPDRASGERSPAPASNSSSGNADEGQVDYNNYVTVILDEPLEQPASSSGVTPANPETDR
ncbi:uncharacterized protein LOC119173815 [Rhipicephalus microplus]|uniref:uncharacterized protein LOC119173815 n=1 Tax=Rhipicephalus microplus TaxID=6941 RepID=UPI003F6AA8CF